MGGRLYKGGVRERRGTARAGERDGGKMKGERNERMNWEVKEGEGEGEGLGRRVRGDEK